MTLRVLSRKPVRSAFPRYYSRRDRLITVGIVLLLLLIGAGYLTTGLVLGDDNAAYITEGIAIAKGELPAQAQRNIMLHPSKLPVEVDQNGLVYVWGFPLLLSFVYRLVGFDSVSYSSIIYYKIPSLITYALLGGVLYLFYRRRCPRWVAVFLSLMLCTSTNLLANLESLYADIPFLFFAMLSLLLTELFLQSLFDSKVVAPSILLGVALGISLWYTYETRLNGVSICIVSLCACLIALHGKREALRRVTPTHRIWIALILPFLLFFLFRFASEHFLFLPATSNMSDLGRTTFAQIPENFIYYVKLTISFLNSLLLFLPVRLGKLLLVLCAVGFFATGMRREELHLTLLFIGTYVVLSLFPSYRQGLRYLFCALPSLLLYLYEGGRWIFVRVTGLLWPSRRFWKRLICVSIAATLLYAMIRVSLHDLKNLAYDRFKDNGAYSTDAVEIYHYIQGNTQEDAIFASGKPRNLYLNTNRMGFKPKINGHDPLSADYWLLTSPEDDSLFDLESNLPRLELDFQNDTMRIYRVLEH